MNQLTPRPETSMTSVGITNGVGGSSITPQNLGEVVRFAEVMCKADIALPQHLRGNAGACMAVALQAMEWSMSIFAVASKSYAVGGRIAYEAQLIAAVVNTRSGIKGRLKYVYEGEKDNMVCRVTGILDGDECVYESPPLGQITPKNSPLWKTDPRQQLGYYSARSWARRYCPEVILGVYDRDEVEHRGPDNAKDVTPRPSLMNRLQPQSGEPAEGFSAGNITRDMEYTDQPGASTAAPADGSEDGGASVLAPDDTASGGPAEPGEVGIDAADSGSDPIKRMVCEECVDNMLREAMSEPAEDREAKIAKMRGIFLEPQNLGDYPEFVDRCAETATRVMGKPAEKSRARDYLMSKVPV